MDADAARGISQLVLGCASATMRQACLPPPNALAQRPLMAGDDDRFDSQRAQHLQSGQ